MEGNWRSTRDGRFTPMPALNDAGRAEDIIKGLVPMDGITWLYGPSMSFKSFVAMSMATAIATGEEWMGLKTKQSEVIYIGAEGGNGLHLRRAAAEFHAGRAATRLTLAQERPQLDTDDGVEYLRGMLDGLFTIYAWNTCHGGEFEELSESEAKERGPFEVARRDYDARQYVIGGSIPSEEDMLAQGDEKSTIVIFIDTYSQTSGGDDKVNVSAYVKNLRRVIEEARKSAHESIAFVVVDHATKAGGSFLGSVAKLNDVDSQIEVQREGSSMRTRLLHRKFKDDRHSLPINLELAPYEFEGRVNAYGEPVRSLIVRDGVKAAGIAEVADGNAGTLLTFLLDAGGEASEDDMRKLFYAHPKYAGAKGETASKAFKRAKDKLEEMETIAERGGKLVVTVI